MVLEVRSPSWVSLDQRPGIGRALFSSGNSGGESVSRLFQHLVAAGVPWLMAPFPHGRASSRPRSGESWDPLTLLHSDTDPYVSLLHIEGPLSWHWAHLDDRSGQLGGLCEVNPGRVTQRINGIIWLVFCHVCMDSSDSREQLCQKLTLSPLTN